MVIQGCKGSFVTESVNLTLDDGMHLYILCLSIQHKGLFKHLERLFITAYLTLSKVHTTLEMLHTVLNNERVNPLLEVGVSSLDDLRLRL